MSALLISEPIVRVIRMISIETLDWTICEFFFSPPLHVTQRCLSCILRDHDDSATSWFTDVRRADRQWARILILGDRNEVKRVLEMFPEHQPEPSTVSTRANTSAISPWERFRTSPASTPVPMASSSQTIGIPQQWMPMPTPGPAVQNQAPSFTYLPSPPASSSVPSSTTLTPTPSAPPSSPPPLIEIEEPHSSTSSQPSSSTITSTSTVPASSLSPPNISTFIDDFFEFLPTSSPATFPPITTSDQLPPPPLLPPTIFPYSRTSYQPKGRIIASPFPGSSRTFRETMAMFLPEYDYRGLAASHYQIVGEVMNRKHAEDQKVIERLEMQQRLSKAFVECRKESGTDLKSCKFILHISRRFLSVSPFSGNRAPFSPFGS